MYKLHMAKDNRLKESFGPINSTLDNKLKVYYL